MLSALSLHGYRWVTEQRLDITVRTAIIGTNGSGKTHILEAIHLASGGVLHTFHAPREDAYSMEAVYLDDIGPKSYRYERQAWRDLYSIQSAKVSGLKYRESLPYRTVFLSPFDMNLFYFAPSMRRDYVDSILARTFAQFTKVRRDYETTMRQRNALLKKIRDGEAERKDLDYWDRTFAEKVNLYMMYREKWIDFVSSSQEPLRDFLPRYEIRFSYESKLLGVEEKDKFIKTYLLEHRERDILTGHTHIGPHLDDFSFKIIGQRQQEAGLPRHTSQKQIYSSQWQEQEGDNRIDATMMLSRGEMKMLLLALKQIEILFLEKSLDLPIILLFDDLFAELDFPHAERVISTFDVDQVIVTTQRPLPKWEKWDDFACINLAPA
jgi:DNA replication and repair protein RecF